MSSQQQFIQHLNGEIARALALFASGNASSEEITEWLCKSYKFLRVLRRMVRKEGVAVHEQQRCQAKIGILKSLNRKFKYLSKVGGRLGRPERRSDRVAWEDLHSAFQNRLRVGVVVNMKHKDTRDFLEDARALFVSRIKNALKRENALKVNAVLAAEYGIVRNNDEEVELKYFNTKNAAIIQTTDLAEWFTVNVLNPILNDMGEFQDRDSGWTLRSIVNLVVNVNKYNPMRGSWFVELPDAIKRKKACINVQNTDNQCFKWAVLSALHPVNRQNHAKRVSKYTPYEYKLNFEGIDFPVMLRDVPKFEKQNEISVNVYVLQKRKEQFTVAPVHITSNKKDKHVNLLMVQDFYVDEAANEYENDNEPPIIYHYVWIHNLSRLVSAQLSKKKGKKYICERCLHYFDKAEKLGAHEKDCHLMNHCRVQLPTPKCSKLKFKNFGNKERVPFIVYADFECLLKKVDQRVTSKTKVCEVHEAYSVGYFVKCSYNDTLSRYESYRGAKPAEWFARQMLGLVQLIENIYQNPVPMEVLSYSQKTAFHNATECHVCRKELTGGDKVRDHCHLTGRYRGAAHNECNLNYQDSRVIPIVFHNFSGYDSHLIVKEISTCIDGHIYLLPLNMERYISFTKHIKNSNIALRFIDSFRFMASSLDKLASYLIELKIMRSQFPLLDENRFTLLTRKGVFPYEHLDTWEKLNTTEFPPKEHFYSHLNACNISDEDYEHAKRIWMAFDIESLGGYSDLYLKTDVLLLADVFENFRDNCLKVYDLDPAHYYTAPGLTWDAMLKYTRIELDLLTDIDMVMFVERGIRGGMSQCSNRYARANNQYMKDYDPDEETKYLMYFDVNNLYGWAMTQHLPYGSFEWVEEDLENFEWNVATDSDIGYILEVDLEYPEAIHDLHKDLPLCPEQMTPPGSQEPKLLTTLCSKTRYIIHYRNLDQALKHGLELCKIHRILKFQQLPWLKSYIDLNSEMRKRAKNEFEKNLFKLMNNAVFGKTMENVRKRVNVKLVTKWEGRYGAEALIAKPNFHSRSIFAENLVAVQLNHTEVLLNKPIYVGFCVLDLSKTCVYSFHYDYMLPEFGDQCKLLYTDTDSLLYEVCCPDFYAVMKRDIERFDTSDYPTDNPYRMPQVNKKVVGLMKDECNGQVMTEFVGLRSKMYSARVEGEDWLKKAKGVKTSVVKRTIDFDDYLACLLSNDTLLRTQRAFQSRLHEVRTVQQVKLALSPYDDKRYLLPDTTDTLPWGHYKIIN